MKLTKEKIWYYFNYDPLRSSNTFHESDKKFKAIIGSGRTGKTHKVLMDIVTRMFTHPGGERLIWNMSYDYNELKRDFNQFTRFVGQYNTTFGPFRKYSFKNLYFQLMNGDSYESKNLDSPESYLMEAPSFIIINDAEKVPLEIWRRYVLCRRVTNDAPVYMISKDRNFLNSQQWKELFSKFQEMGDLDVFKDELLENPLVKKV